MVRKQSRLYQESVRSLAELDDTTGVDLCAGQSAVRDRSMVAIKEEKMERARTYRRIMQVLSFHFTPRCLVHRFLSCFGCGSLMGTTPNGQQA